MKHKKLIFSIGIISMIIIGFSFAYLIISQKYQFSKKDNQTKPTLVFPSYPATPSNYISKNQSTSTLSISTSSLITASNVELPPYSPTPQSNKWFSGQIEKIDQLNKSFVLKQEDKLFTVFIEKNTRIVLIDCPETNETSKECNWQNKSFSDLKAGDWVILTIKGVKNNNILMVNFIQIYPRR